MKTIKDDLGESCIDISGKTLSEIEQILHNLELMEICSHESRRHRAKFMCHHCYLNKAYDHKASACPHTTRAHHSQGLCKYCYHKLYKEAIVTQISNYIGGAAGSTEMQAT